MIPTHDWSESTSVELGQASREVNGATMLNQLLDIEGVDREPIQNATRTELDRLSIHNFRILMNDEDPRWRLVYKMHRLKSEGALEGAYLEHALRADYLSNHPSIRRGFARYIDEITIPQLARALANLEIGNLVKPQFEKVLSSSTFYNCNYEVGRIGANHKPDDRGIMGCQEGVWQLQIFETFNYNKFLGRIGFNFHMENGSPIISITNIQGASNAKEANELFVSINGHGFGEFLINSLRLQLGESFTLRGVQGRPENKALYNSVFRNANVPQYKVKRFSNEEYAPSFEKIFEIEEDPKQDYFIIKDTLPALVY
jgi:hypothetical protein